MLINFISTHTLTWSVTAIVSPDAIAVIFQLTRSRGAWHKPQHCLFAGRNFNSHAHVERDCRSERRSQDRYRFQLTRSRGAWPDDTQMSVCVLNFNSHAHVERDSVNHLPYLPKTISTHTLTWSVTGYTTRETKVIRFQLTRSRGAWQNHNYALHSAYYFNSHAHVERDCCNSKTKN